MRVNQVMTRGVECVRPYDTIAAVAQRMAELDVGALPVCGDDDRLKGIVTDRDITVRATAGCCDPGGTYVKDVMTPNSIYVFDDQDVTEAARLMRESQVRRLTVLNRAKRLVGIVSLGDLAVDTHDERLAGATLEAVSEPAAPRRSFVARSPALGRVDHGSRREDVLSPGLSLLGGLGLGAGLMYLFDPAAGRRRRALLRDQLVHALSRMDDRVDATVSDLSHRAEGLAAAIRASFVSEQVSDEVLAARVRSKLGRYTSHPHAIGVAAHNGQIVLTGSVLKREVGGLLRATSKVRGVAGVDASGLVIHDEPGDRPWLQGGRRRSGERLNLLEENWAPTTRLLAGAVGCGLMANCLARRTPLAVLLGTAGFGLFVRSVTNAGLGRLLGVAGGCGAVEVHKTITIAGPVERVFPVFARYSAFPSFMAHLREVRDLGDGRSRWVAEGPAGTPVSWDAVVTRCEANRLLAWQSEPGSVIPNAGVLRFEPTPQGDTRVHIDFAYTPPGGVLGHLAARLFGADAKSAMDEDLVRLKSLIEEGKTRAPGKEAPAHPAL